MKSIRVNNTGKKRKAGLSNVVGSLLLIILTIIAALLLGHFVFGLFASNSHNAGLEVSDVSVILPGGNTASSPTYVTLTITDNGNDPISIATGAITMFGGTAAGSLAFSAAIPSSTTTLQPGQSVTFTTTVPANSGVQVGQTVVFTVTAKDTNTGQSLSTQTSTVVAD